MLPVLKTDKDHQLGKINDRRGLLDSGKGLGEYEIRRDPERPGRYADEALLRASWRCTATLPEWLVGSSDAGQSPALRLCNHTSDPITVWNIPDKKYSTQDCGELSGNWEKDGRSNTDSERNGIIAERTRTPRSELGRANKLISVKGTRC